MARNNAAFRTTRIALSMVAYMAVSYLYDCSCISQTKGVQSLQLVISSIQVCWSCPAVEWIKLNTDGAFDAQSKMGGEGFVLRNSAARYLFAGCIFLYVGRSWVNIILAVKEGILAATQLGVNKLIIEIDAECIVKVLNKEEPPPWFLLNSLREIFALLNMIVEWRVIHTFREGNQCAHWLASFAKRSKLDHIWTQDWHPDSYCILCLDEQAGPCSRLLI